ncbi:MAG TPA: alpha/beta hydrolase [Chitinophagales bacterium]|nr:alpha/beta hydrolase [Chitinophagales bacterium]
MNQQASFMNFKTLDVEGVKIFYREAGDPLKPTIVLLHGFPSSSYQFHDLIPLLANQFHVVAPDYPGMGFSDAPDPNVLQPTFDGVGLVMDAFLTQLAPGPIILYMHDIGAPIGMRIALAHPERITGLVFQNEVLSRKGWDLTKLKVYELLDGPETPEKLAQVEQFATVARDKLLHHTGAHRPDALNPDKWAIDAYTFSNDSNRVFMSRLFLNYSTNFESYAKWNAYLKDKQPKTLIVWGNNDPLFVPTGPELIKQVLPSAEVRYFDGGHFALDEFTDEIGDAIIETFSYRDANKTKQ